MKKMYKQFLLTFISPEKKILYTEICFIKFLVRSVLPFISSEKEADNKLFQFY